LQPAAGWNAAELFVAEAGAMAIIVLSVGLGLASHRFSRYVAWLVGILIGLAIALLGTSTGGSVNPAREFGPAMASGELRFLWVYLTAPLAGSLLAVWLRTRIQRNELRTHRLCGVKAPTPMERVA
jgi:glycerol uptake facilitator protein/aquaporin Z